MAWVTADEMRALEASAFSCGVDAGNLMDKAGAGIARRLLDHFPHPGRAVAFVGKGNNGGDAVVVLEHLRDHGWKIALRFSHPAHEWSVLTRQRVRRLEEKGHSCPVSSAVPTGPGPLLLLDGLLGIGVSGSLREPLASLAAEMESLRQEHGALVVGIDLPSGLDADDGKTGAVVADLTVTVGVPKRGLLADEAAPFCGRLYVVPLEELPPPNGRQPRVITPENFPGLLGPRPHTWHKGDAGRVAVLAGSSGMSGAAELCARGALHGGAGLVTLFLDPDNPARPTAEILTHRAGNRVAAAFESKADAIVAGPGLGHLTPPQRETLLASLSGHPGPLILDADALNLIASEKRADLLDGRHLITPHPGEFARLAPDLTDLPRAEAAKRFTDRHPCTLLLKGARTIVAAPGGDLRWNPTGHAGMASGGQGDVLAGVCAALAAGGIALPDAACLAAWLCGRAAERAITHGGESEPSCTASDTLAHLGGAFTDWRQRRR